MRRCSIYVYLKEYKRKKKPTSCPIVLTTRRHLFAYLNINEFLSSDTIIYLFTKNKKLNCCSNVALLKKFILFLCKLLCLFNKTKPNNSYK